ncbi:uncharacterized protein LOC143776462 [Ranitomeya variabilis]|uniref:uncharacterized protein LOC143776462 n=1 Tax=Ranitomeya variabilis TaxID=490064 RepID=UPI0040576043
MKIVVIFLCVALASFIDTGNGNPTLTFQNINVDSHVRSTYTITTKYEELQGYVGLEWNTQARCIVNDLIFELQCLARELGCSLQYLLQISGIPPQYCKLILAGDIDGLLRLDIKDLLTKFLFCVEGLLAKLGYVLSDLLNTLTGALGIVGGLPSICSGLHLDLKAIISFLSGTLLGGALDIVGGVLQTVAGVVGVAEGVLGSVVGVVGNVVGGVVGGVVDVVGGVLGGILGR